MMTSSASKSDLNHPSSTSPAPSNETQPPRVHLLLPTKPRDSTYCLYGLAHSNSEQARSSGDINVSKEERRRKGDSLSLGRGKWKPRGSTSPISQHHQIEAAWAGQNAAS
ncbi:unnamed protein product [Linum trigynum]|uniref:Uncharacterized protein n=1 Tax=Linum trigynum TaxID=586398 RepID=A0AAV2CU54_9ROSI